MLANQKQLPPAADAIPVNKQSTLPRSQPAMLHAFSTAVESKPANEKPAQTADTHENDKAAKIMKDR